MHCRADGSREAMSCGRAAGREGEDATRFSERVKVRRATRSTCERGWGLRPGLHGLGGDEAEDRTLSTAPKGPKPSQAGGVQLHGGTRQDCWQQRGGWPQHLQDKFLGPRAACCTAAVCKPGPNVHRGAALVVCPSSSPDAATSVWGSSRMRPLPSQGTWWPWVCPRHPLVSARPQPHCVMLSYPLLGPAQNSSDGRNQDAGSGPHRGHGHGVRAAHPPRHPSSVHSPT